MSSGIPPPYTQFLFRQKLPVRLAPQAGFALFEGSPHLPCLNNPGWPQMSTDARKHFPMTSEKVNPYPPERRSQETILIPCLRS